MFQRFRYLSRVRWWLLGLLTLLLVVQWSPYAALATWPQGAIAFSSSPATKPSTLPLSVPPAADRTLLAQLQTRPNRTVTLPNFDPTQDTFQFSNQELIDAIDLERNAPAWEEVLTEQMEQMFGTQVCMGSDVQPCVLTTAAKDWLQTQLQRMDLGIAEGMAAAALALWQPNRPASIPWWQRLFNFLIGRVVFGLARTLFDLQTFIANLFLTQGVREIFQLTQDIREGLSPTQILLTLLDSFLSSTLDPFTMGVYRIVRGVLTEGHALTPYRIEARDDETYWVYVYDSNYPVGRANTPPDLHVEFNTRTDTWRYQPRPDLPPYEGSTDSHNLDLTQLSWRQVEKQAKPPYRGPFTCPFCGTTTATEDIPTMGITLIGEGLLTVTKIADETTEAPALSSLAEETATLVPFRGGLSREVPASYRLSEADLNHPLQITLQGVESNRRTPARLQLTGPGYTADFANLNLLPEERLTLYAVLTSTGPELTFVANRAMEIPPLSIHLTDRTTSSTFDSSTAEYFSLTDRQVSKSSEFELSGLKIPAGKRVALAAKTDLKRLYFADDVPVESQYRLRVRNRMVIRDRIQIGERQPDFLNYTLTYEEEMQARNLQVDRATQAFFNYDPAFIDPGDQPRQDLLTAFEQRDFPITIAYEPLTTNSGEAAPLRLRPSGTAPIATRVFQSTLRKANNTKS